MFSNIISDSITPTFVSAGIDTPYAPNVQSVYQTGLIPGSPAAEVQPIDPVSSRLDSFADSEQSRDASMRSDYFNWDKSGAAAYKDDSHFSTIGFNPFVGSITDPTTGNTVNPYVIRYQQASDWGDVLSKGAGMFVGLAGLTAKAGLQSDAHLINALFNPFSWADYASGKDTFTSKMMGSPEELMETDRELKAIMNKYHIHQTPETQEGIFNKEFFGDIVGQLGFSAGAAGYMLGTGILMAGFGRLLGAGKTIAAMTRLGKAMEQMKDVGHLDDLKKVQNLMSSGRTATAISEDVNMVKRMTDLGKNRSFIQGVVENFTPFYQAVTDARAVKTAGGTGMQMFQATVPGLIKNYTMMSAARAEASIEAAGTYGDLYIGLMDSFYEKEGRLPDATEAANIKNTAYGAATDNYIVNTGLLMTMNSIQFGNMMSKFSSTKRLFRELAEASDDGLMAVKGKLKDGVNDVYKVYNKNSFGGIGAYNKVRKDFGLGTAMYTVLKNNAKHLGKWEVSEGLQELLQEGSNKSLTEYYTNMYHGNKDVDGNILNRVDLAKGLGDQLNKEGWKTFLMGSVTGLFMSPLTSAVMYGKTAGAKALYSNVREAAENKKKTVEANRQLLETFFNNPENMTKGFSRFKEQMKVSKNIGDAAATNDPYMSHNSKDDAISQAAGAAVKAGMLDAFVDNIRMMGDGRFTPKEFMEQFNLTEEVDPKQYTEQLATNIEQYYTNVKNLKDRYSDLVIPELEKDPAKQLDAQWKRAALNEAIEILAYNTYHAGSAMTRAAEIKTAAGQIPGIGQVTSRMFDLLGNNSELDKEVKLLKLNLKVLKDTAAGDSDIAEQVKATEDRIEALETWKEKYNRLLDSKEESEEMDNLKKELQFYMRLYIESDNQSNGRSNTNLLDADFEKAFKLLGDYNAINRDYSQYIEILNLLSNPKNFVTMHSKLFDSMIAARDIVKEEAKKEADLRADITNGDPVPPKPDDKDDDVEDDNSILPVTTYTPVETKDNELKTVIEEKKEQLQEKKERLKREQELSDLLINYPTMEQLSPLQLVRYRGQNGYIEIDEETGTMYFNAEDGRSFVIEKIDGDYSKPSYEYEVFVLENKEQPTPIEVSEDTEGRVIITMYGTEYVNMYTDPLMAINRDSDGNVISVDLNVNDGNKAPRTFKGKNSNLANEIAYNILLHTYEKENNRTREESSSTPNTTNAGADISRKEQAAIEGTDEDQIADNEIENNNKTASTNKEEEELYFLELLLAAKTSKDVKDIIDFLEEDGKEEYSFLLEDAAEKLNKLQEQEEKERLIEEEKKANVVKANKRKEIQKQREDEIAAIKKKYLNTAKNPKTPEELAKKEQLLEAATKKYQALLDALDGKKPVVTPTPVTAALVNQTDKDKIQNINNMNILTLAGTAEQKAAKDAVLRDTTPEELRAGLRLVSRLSVDDIERVELPDGKIQLLDKRVTTSVKDLGTFPEDDEDGIQAAIKKAMMPFKKGDYVQQMRSTYTVAVYYGDTLIGYLQPEQQYLFTFNGQLVDVDSLTPKQFAAVAIIPKGMTAKKALTEFQQNVANSLSVWSGLEPLLAAGNTVLSGEEIPFRITPSRGENDFNNEKGSITKNNIQTASITRQGTQVDIEIKGDSGKEFLFTIDRNNSITLWAEKKLDGTYTQGTDAVPIKEKEKLYNKYVPKSLQEAITNWTTAFTGSWANENTKDGKAHSLAEKALEKEILKLKETDDTANRPTIADVQELYEVEGIIDSAANEVFDSKNPNLIKEQPEYAGNLGNYRVAVKLPNGQRVWLQAKGIKMTDSDVKDIAKKITAFFGKKKKTAKDIETLNELLSTIFITARPENANGIFFDFRISDKGNLAVRWYDPFMNEGQGASGIIDVAKNETPFTDMDSFTTYLTAIINTAMTRDAAVKEGVMWPKDGVTFTEYNVRKQPDVNALDQMEITSNIGLVKNIVPTVVPETPGPIKGLNVIPEQTNIPAEPSVEGKSSVDVPVAVTQQANGTQPIESNKKDIISFETSKGSIYKYTPTGNTVRFKTVENKEYPEQDITVFIKLENVQQEEDYLGAARRIGGKKLYIIDTQGNILNKNEEIANKEIRVAIIKDNKVIDSIPAYSKPIIGYNTFDQRRFNKDGEDYREVHIGNKVSKINYTTTTQQTTAVQPTVEALAQLEDDDWIDSIIALKTVPADEVFTGQSVENIGRFSDYIKKNLPSWLTIEEVDSFIDTLYNNNITAGEFMYYLDKTGNVQAVIRTNKDSVAKYHEAFHMVFRLLLPQETIDRLFIEVAGIYPATPERLEKLRRSSPLYAEMSEEQLTEILYEEYMADEFDSFRMGRTTRVTTGIRGLFNRLTDWINWLWAQFTGADMKGLFYEIEQGAFRNSTVQSNQYVNNIGTSANVAKKVIPIGTETIQTPSGPKQVTKYLPQQEGEIISSTMAALFLKKALLEGSYNTNAVYKEILDTYANMYNPADPKYRERAKEMARVDKEAAIRWFLRLKERHNLFTSDAGRTALKDAANVYLRISGIKTEMEEDETEDLTDDYGERNVEDRKRPTTYAALSAFLRMFIGGTTVTFTDEFGNTEFSAGVPLVQAINANKVYNGMIKLLSNQSEGVDMVSRMWSMRNDDSNPETAALIREIIKETGLEYNDATKTFSTSKNEIIIQQVIKGFNMFELDHLFVQMDTDNKVRVFSANAQEVTQNQLNAWSSEFEVRLGNKLVGKSKKDVKEIVTTATGGFDEMLSTMNNKTALATHIGTVELQNLSKQIANRIYAGTGIKLSPRYIEYSIAFAKNDDVRTAEQRVLLRGYTDVEPLTAEDIRGIKYSLLKGDNVFIETEDNKGAIGRLKTMALGNAQFDESVNTMSYQTADGETVYSHTLPSWITVMTNKLNNEMFREDLMQDPDRQSYLLYNERFLELARQRKIKVIGADGIKRVDMFEPGATVDDTGRAVTNTEGRVMGDFTTRENAIFLFSTYVKPKNVVTTQKPIERYTDEDGGEYATESFTTAPVMLRTIEAKNQAFFMELPILTAVENNRLSQQVVDIMYDMVLQEQQRISRVKEEIKTIAKQATRPLTKGEVRVEKKEGYHTGKKNADGTWKTPPRGLKLFNAALMVGDMAADIEAGKPIDKDALTEQLNRYWLAETEALITDMRVMGLVRKEEDGIKNLLAPEYLFKGEKGDYNLIPGNFFHNVMQVFVNDYVNSAAANKLLLGEEAMSFKDPIDQVKRASGWAAAGPDMRVLVTAPEWRINHTLSHFHHFTFSDPRFRKMSDGVDKDGKLENTGEKADGQMYMTEKALRYALFGFATLNKTQVDALNTLADGNELSKEEVFGSDGLVKAGAFNSMKLVYFDGQNYLKNSTFPLFKTFTSLKDSNGEFTIPWPGREHLHELRIKMEEFEAKSDTVVFGHPASASKGMKVDIASTVSDITDNNFQQLDAQYMRKQVENPSNKIVITSPTQAMTQIMAEQNPDTKVVFLGSEKDSDGNDWTVGRVRDIYQQSIAQRKTNNFNTAVNDIVDYEGVMVELQTSIDIQKLTPKLGRFIKNAQEMLMATGADSQTLGFFELDEQGEPIYDMNFPAVLTKYTQLFLSYFSKGILSEKVPGMSVATVSPWGIRKIKVVTSIWKEGDKGYKKALEGQPRTWKVVTDAEIIANPAAYSNPIDWSTQDVYARRYEGLKEGDIYVDDLRHNYAKYDDNGNYLGQFSECLIPAHYKDVMDKIPAALRFMFGIRIPSDDKHSYVALEYVDTLPAQYGSVGVFPQEIIEISGMDFDIDKMYIEMADTYLVGNTRIPYGTAVTPEDKMLEWLTWQLDNKTPLKRVLSDKIDSDPEIKELRKEIKDLTRYREDLQQQWLDTQLFITDIITRSVRSGIKEEQAVVSAEYRAATEQLKNLRGYLLQESLSELGMPNTLDAFEQAGGEELNNGVLTNRALSAKLAMLNNDDIAVDTEDQLSILNQGTSVDILSSLVTDLVDEFTAMQGNESIPAANTKNIVRVLKVLLEPAVNVDSLRGKLISATNNKEGSRNIGAAVLAMLVFSITNQHELSLSSEDYQLYFNGEKYNSFIDTKTSDGKRKFAQISAIVNAMTDNAKERLAAKLGLNIEAVGYVSAMVALGVPIKTATLMMLQPIVRTYFKQLQATKGSIKTDEEKKMRSSKLLANMVASVKNIGGVELTDANMVSNIASGDNNSAVSASAIRMLAGVDKIGSNISEIAKITRLQKGLPKTWDEIDGILKAATRLSDPTIPAPIPFYDVIDNDPIIRTNLRILRQINNIAPAFFTERTAAFTNITDIIHANFEPERRADRDRYIATVKNDLLSFLAIKAYMHNMAGKPEVIDSLRHSLIYPTAGQQTIVDIVKELRELISTEGSGRNRKNLMIHNFLNAVDSKITETGIDELRARNWTKLSEGYIESLAGAFVDLYSNSITDKNNKPLNTHTQAIAIFNYLLVKDGGQFKNNSFLRYIPNFVFMDLLSSSKEVNEMMKLGYRATEEDYMRVFGASLKDVRKQFIDSYGMHTNNFYNIKKVSGYTGAVTVTRTDIKINTTVPPAVELDTIGGFSYTTDINENTGATEVIYQLPHYVKILDKLYKLSTVDGAAVTTGSSTLIQTGREAEYTVVYGGSRGSKNTSMMTGVFGELPIKPGIQPAATEGQSEAAPVPTAGNKEKILKYHVEIEGVRYREYTDGSREEVEYDDNIVIPDAYNVPFEEPTAGTNSFTPQEDYSALFEDESTISAQPVVSSQTMRQTDLFAQQQPVADTSIQRPFPGVENIPDTGLSKEVAQSFINLIAPDILKSGVKVNRSKSANIMLGYGLRYTIKNGDYNIPGHTVAIDAHSKAGYYIYQNVGPFGEKLLPLSHIQPIIDYVQGKTGIDMQDYDSVILNVYDPTTAISAHSDTEESISATKYPVIAINIGGDGSIIMNSDRADKKTIPLKNGSIYMFGVNGENRLIKHMTVAATGNNNPLAPLEIPTFDYTQDPGKYTGKHKKKEGTETVKDYRVTITFRRAADLKKGMPDAPRRMESSQPMEPVQQPTAIEQGTYVTYNEETYIVTKRNSTGTWQIYNPTLEGTAAKKSVSAANLTPTATRASIVEYKDKEYIVTPKGTIISLTSNKKMEWGPENGDRKAILSMVQPTAVQQQTTPIQFKEHSLSDYASRTRENASADVTIALAVDFNSAGEKLTKSSVTQQGKMYIPIDLNKGLEVTAERVDKIIDMLNRIGKPEITMNIAGNGIYTMAGKYTQPQLDEFMYQLLAAVLQSSNLKTKIVAGRTGGQTGMDEAGAKAMSRLGIPITVLAPKGWKMRGIDGKDVSGVTEFQKRFLPAGSTLPGSVWKTELAAIYKEKGDKKGRTELEWTNAAIRYRDNARLEGTTDQKILDTIKCIK